MRALPVRRIATPFLCTVLLLGTAGPVHAVSLDDPARDPAQSVPRAPLPGAEALLAQTKQLADLASVLKPVTDLLDAVLKAPDGKLPAADLNKHVEAIKKALEAVEAPAPKGTGLTDSEAQAPEGTEAPGTEAQAPEGTQVPDTKAPPLDAKAPLDIKADAVTALRKAIDDLVKAVNEGDPKAISRAAPAVVTGLVNLVAATLIGGKLPAPNLPGLPPMPKPPA
ncbi:hypothetical protein [Streptomyces sp. NPDC017941]|uniref:hypothetical protein n=1 Tax=Streptomyces sp. NPDC017941 TaxID=3365018 RepID=UPI003795CD05